MRHAPYPLACSDCPEDHPVHPMSSQSSYILIFFQEAGRCFQRRGRAAIHARGSVCNRNDNDDSLTHIGAPLSVAGPKRCFDVSSITNISAREVESSWMQMKRSGFCLQNFQFGPRERIQKLQDYKSMEPRRRKMARNSRRDLPVKRSKLHNDLCFLSSCSITRTFASGKTEKMVMQCLKDLGFPSGKVSGKMLNIEGGRRKRQSNSGSDKGFLVSSAQVPLRTRNGNSTRS